MNSGQSKCLQRFGVWRQINRVYFLYILYRFTLDLFFFSFFFYILDLEFGSYIYNRARVSSGHLPSFIYTLFFCLLHSFDTHLKEEQVKRTSLSLL